MDDDLIRAALGAGVEPDPSPALLARAVAAGAVRRRRRVTAVTAAAAVALVVGVAGAVVVPRDGDEEIVGVSQTTIIDVTSTTTGAPATTAPATTASPTTTPTTTAAPPPAETLPPTVPGGTSAPFVPLVTAASFGSRSVSFVVDAPPPSGDDAFAARAPDGRLQLWSFDPDLDAAPVVAAWIRIDPCSEDAWCAGVLAYDGRFLWVQLDASYADDGLTLLEPAVLLRADVATGTVDEVPVALSRSSSPPEDRVLDIRPTGAGGATLVTEHDGTVTLWSIGSDLAVTGEESVPISAAGVISARVNDSTLLAYSWAVPREGVSSVRVVDLVTGTERVLLDPAPVYPVVRGFSLDGTHVLLADDWEDRYVVEVSSSGGTSAADVLSGDSFADACYVGDGSLIIGRWRWAYAETPAEAGAIEVLSADRSVVAQLSGPIVGSALACLGNGSVSTLVWTMDADGYTALARTGVVVGPDGDQRELGPDIEPVPMRTVDSAGE